MQNTQAILQKFREINVCKRGDERAPHKPLLLLYMLGRCRRGESCAAPYLEIERALTGLLRDFGPPRPPHPEMPFWYLKNDGLWFIEGAGKLERRPGRSDPKRSELRQHNPVGGLLPEIAKALGEDQNLMREVVAELLQRNFPDSVHEDILAAVGLDSAERPESGPHTDPDFRVKVLRAYGHRCAICGFDLKLGAIDLALEAAHIKWHQAGGPAIESNGLALCALHHKMFDRGAFSISGDLRVLISQDVYGTSRAGEWFLAFHGGKILSPQSLRYLPREEYLCWHRTEVFRAPARDFAETSNKDCLSP